MSNDDLVKHLGDLLGLGEGDRQRTGAVARDLAGMTGLSEKAALRMLWVAGLEGFIATRLDHSLADGIEDLLLNTSGGQSIREKCERVLRGELGL